MKMNIVKIILRMALLCGITAPCLADVRLPAIFGDGMVLQRGKPVPIWGWADPGEQVTVLLGKQVKKTQANATGKWRVDLNALPVGGPYTLSVTGKNKFQLNDILSGDVWLCSGQSNMELEVKYAQHATAEIAAANYPLIRHIRIPVAISLEEKEELAAPAIWQKADPANAGEFSAVGYFFARRLFHELQVPIGIINASKGATLIEPWIAKTALENNADLHQWVRDYPQTSLEQANEERHQQILGLVESVQGKLPVEADVAHFNEPEWDSRSWPLMHIPSIWEQGQLKNFDGTVWFRREIDITSEMNTRDSAFINFGFVDDNDIVYVNGKQIGASYTPQVFRRYAVSPGLLKKGKNVVAVRVDDIGGNGGFYGKAGDYSLVIGEKLYPLAGNWQFQVAAIHESAWKIGPNSFPGLLFNTMIHPLISFPVRGVLWYQGEGNVGGAPQYRKALPLLINDWRKQWQTDFPFYFVQLSSYEGTGNSTNSNTGSYWAELREAQAATLDVPHTGMAVTIDIGNPVNIHPENKQAVGDRLAAQALRKTYGKKITCNGPVYKKHHIAGSAVTVYFDDVVKGLQPGHAGMPIRGFEVAGKDGYFFPAEGHIHGNTVVVSSENVTTPVVIRYGWMDDAGICNLFNSAGFPAAPFRSDKPF